VRDTHSDWPHDKIRSASLAYIRKTCGERGRLAFTRLDALPERLARIVQLDPGEHSVVNCFIDAQRWYVMTTGRIFGWPAALDSGCSPLDVTQWRWDDFKHGGRSEVEVATFSLANGTHLRISYETGHAAMAPIYYERFWTIKYPILDKLE